MFRIEIKAIIELEAPAQSQMYKRTHQKMLKREIERAAEDPIAYQLAHECSTRVVGSLLEGPIASSQIEKQVTEKEPPTWPFAHSLEPQVFPTL
jgi:hypothetical protein